MTEEQAKARFLTLSLVRLSGVVLMFLGLANAQGRLLPDLAPWLGLVLCVAAMADFFLAPRLLKQAWKRQDDA